MINIIYPNREHILKLLKAQLGYVEVGDEAKFDTGRLLYYQFIEEMYKLYKFERCTLSQFLMVMLIGFKRDFPANQPGKIDVEDAQKKIRKVKLMLARPKKNSYDMQEIGSFVAVIKICGFNAVKDCISTDGDENVTKTHQWMCHEKCTKNKLCRGFKLWSHWKTGMIAKLDLT